jgi:hypothetical protein
MPRRTFATRAFLACCAFALAARMLPSCALSTSGARVSLSARVTPTPASLEPFVNGKGYSVTVERALVSLGAVRAFDGAPVVAMAPSWPAFFRLAEPAAAHAHPGHYASGDALAEWLPELTVDLLAGPTHLPDAAAAVSGTYRSAELVFESPPRGELAPELGDALVAVEGTALVGGEPLVFRAVATEAELLSAEEVPRPAVVGLAFDEAAVASAGEVVLSVDLPTWLDQVDFADVATPPAGARAELEGSAREAFARGVKKGAAYALRFEPATP